MNFHARRGVSSHIPTLCSGTNYQQGAWNRKEAMTQAYRSGAYPMAEIGEHFGVHYMTVSRAVREFEGT